MYQALSFYKILENVSAVFKQQSRSAARAGQPAPADPMVRQIPADHAALANMTDWGRDLFTPYLGKTFGQVRDAVSDTIRNAVAHLTPGRDVRSADLLDDIQACRQVTPVIRYIARDLITEALVRG